MTLLEVQPKDKHSRNKEKERERAREEHREECGPLQHQHGGAPLSLPAVLEAPQDPCLASAGGYTWAMMEREYQNKNQGDPAPFSIPQHHHPSL